MLESKIDQDGSIVISRNKMSLLRIEEFPDPSHPGHHLFLTPLNKAIISESPTDCTPGYNIIPWTHELLR